MRRSRPRTYNTWDGMSNKRRFNLLSIGRAMPRIIDEIVRDSAIPTLGIYTHTQAYPAYLLWAIAPLIAFDFPTLSLGNEIIISPPAHFPKRNQLKLMLLSKNFCARAQDVSQGCVVIFVSFLENSINYCEQNQYFIHLDYFHLKISIGKHRYLYNNYYFFMARGLKISVRSNIFSLNIRK